MNANFIQVTLDLPEQLREPAIALLSEAGYEAFMETDEGVEAFVAETAYSEETLKATLAIFPEKEVGISTQLVLDKNWNAEWESQYKGVYIDNFCQVIPSFKSPEPGFIHTIYLDPKMSFGTGHHETTRLMVRQLQSLDLSGKSVLDMGCGTGVLAILAAKKGAKPVTAIDIDPWSIENSKENVSRNETSDIQLLLGGATAIPDTFYDVILANINRNVLLADCAAFAGHLEAGGMLVASGFYRKDQEVLESAFQAVGLFPEKEKEENNWLSLLFIKR